MKYFNISNISLYRPFYYEKISDENHITLNLKPLPLMSAKLLEKNFPPDIFCKKVVVAWPNKTICIFTFCSNGLTDNRL